MSAVPVYVWQPTTDEIAARAGIPPAAVVRFDQNTSPGSPPWVAEELAAASGSLHDYPRADYRPLREAIAAYHGLDDPGQVVVGAGADEMILVIAKTWLGPGAAAVAESPTYALYRIATLQLGARLVAVPRPRPSLSFPAAELAAAAAGADLTWLCVPHNPLGDRPSDAEVTAVADGGAGITVIDAAYAEFAGLRPASLLAGGGDVIVLGTLSKAFGLAGIRVGYALASPPLAARIEAMRPPGSISTTSAALARRALSETSWMEENVRRITAARADLAARLSGLGLTPRPSETNFVLAAIGPGAGDAAARLMDTYGLVVRSFGAGHPLSDHLRFTVRTPDDHDRLIDALERVL